MCCHVLNVVMSVNTTRSDILIGNSFIFRLINASKWLKIYAAHHTPTPKTMVIRSHRFVVRKFICFDCWRESSCVSSRRLLNLDKCKRTNSLLSSWSRGSNPKRSPIWFDAAVAQFAQRWLYLKTRLNKPWKWNEICGGSKRGQPFYSCPTIRVYLVKLRTMKNLSFGIWSLSLFESMLPKVSKFISVCSCMSTKRPIVDRLTLTQNRNEKHQHILKVFLGAHIVYKLLLEYLSCCYF